MYEGMDDQEVPEGTLTSSLFHYIILSSVAHYHTTLNDSSLILCQGLESRGPYVSCFPWKLPPDFSLGMSVTSQGLPYGEWKYFIGMLIGNYS